MVAVGALIVVAVIYFVIKRYETHMVLFVAGVVMATLAGNGEVYQESYTRPVCAVL
ncbi:hypothetical protein [Thermosinus carboxydivorans]|uniref:hypothetical protein n=1 Tax=Thermosinus carboxydivorans TaxID=261685 RepID=UPI000313A2E9|nr:hypothetical protein [Thermosinus carboxydivorans]